jgi:hypothetical protein
MLEASLASPRLRDVPDRARQMLKAHAARDVSELSPHLGQRAEVLSERARRKLTERGEKEAQAMVGILKDQERRIRQEIDKLGKDPEGQLSFEFRDVKDPAERRQREADRRYWPTRLAAIERELVDEPARIRAAYGVQASRVEPVGLVYLWPVSA